MILLRVISGTQAGAQKVTRRFPVLVGRESGAHLVLQDPGVWASHFQVTLRAPEGFFLIPSSEATTLLNDEGVTAPALLRNGDVITAGSARVQFWLSPTRQRSGRILESLIWAGIAAVTLAQVGLIYWLLNLGD